MKTDVQVVRVKAGYVGQVVLADLRASDIVWESAPKKTEWKAHKAATKHLAGVFA